MTDVGAEHVVHWLMSLRREAYSRVAEVEFELCKLVGDGRHAALTERDGTDPMNPYRRIREAGPQ